MKRYAFTMKENYGDPIADMEESPTGMYVLASDADAEIAKANHISAILATELSKEECNTSFLVRRRAELEAKTDRALKALRLITQVRSREDDNLSEDEMLSIAQSALADIGDNA